MTSTYLTTSMRARCLVDRIAPRPRFALSTFRRLRRDHRGGAFALVRSSDSEYGVIPCRGQSVDIAGAKDFVGAADGLGALWIDQGGAGNDLFGVVGAVQPKLIVAGALQTYATVPAWNFDGGDDQVGRADSSGLSGNVSFTLGMVCKINATTGYYCMFMVGTAGTHLALNANNANQINLGANGGYTYGGLTNTSVHRYMGTHTAPNDNTDYTFSVDGVTQSGTPFGTGSLNIAGATTVLGAQTNFAFYSSMSVSFLALWDAVLTADEHLILQDEMALHAA